jgi:hypothetical protein
MPIAFIFLSYILLTTYFEYRVYFCGVSEVLKPFYRGVFLKYFVGWGNLVAFTIFLSLFIISEKKAYGSISFFALDRYIKHFRFRHIISFLLIAILITCFEIVNVIIGQLW